MSKASAIARLMVYVGLINFMRPFLANMFCRFYAQRNKELATQA